jgi:flagellum-specific peptidoglycan hydrolase FlgJ
VKSVRKPRWQQSTALVSLTTCGAMTGFALAHGTVADLTSPTSMPVHLLASSKPAEQEPTDDTALRSAIVKAARYYLRLARDNSPAEMQALIWRNDSADGADHGESCAAFASLVLEMGAQATGQDSWVSGGNTYPWPLYGWADVRVEPNPNSPGVVSILQDAQAHGRWHPLGDGYTPQPGDFVLFDGHVEVVTKYARGVLYTIGGDSMPNLSVNAHQFAGPLAAQGVLGFVNNGEQVATTSQSGPVIDDEQADLGQAAIPGLLAEVLSPAPAQQTTWTRTPQAAAFGAAVIPGLQPLTGTFGAGPAAQPGTAYGRSQQPATQPGTSYGRSQQPATQVPGTATQQAFISQIAPAAVAAQRTYHIPAAVTIAQAIDESGWGQSELATQYHNLFGIKGTGPAGSVELPTEEYENGAWVATTASFRVYYNVAQSIADHSRLLAYGESYQQAMTQRQDPDAFANDLTGVYATDPDYGANLIALMHLYHLYRYDPTPTTAQATTATPPQLTTQQTAVDHGTDLPGLQQTDLALGGFGPAGKPAGPPARVAPRPRAGHGRPAPQGGYKPGGSGRNRPGPGAPGPGGTGEARIPGYGAALPVLPVVPVASASASALAAPARLRVRKRAKRYAAQLPSVVLTDFTTMAKQPLGRAKPMYQDVARRTNIPWQVLAACDWMQCRGEPRYSPVRGEKLGTKNPDGTRYRTKSEALEQCAADLIALSGAVYRIDLTAPLFLSVLELAQVFAAFRWGGLLSQHRVSAMEFPYSVEGLTVQHLDLRWPDIREPSAPDKPGTRFRMPFGAVPVVLSLDYPAVA